MSLADELRKVEQKWRQHATGVSNNNYVKGMDFQAKVCADELSALLDQHAVAEPQVCEKTMHMYVWTRQPRFVAVAQAENVERAREILLKEIETSRDGSCPEREAADKWVRENNPSIWHQRNAEFALTDSAELREQEDYSNKLQKKLDELTAAHAAEQPKLTEEQVEEEFRDWRDKQLYAEPKTAYQQIHQAFLAGAALLTSPVTPPPPDSADEKSAHVGKSGNAPPRCFPNLHLPNCEHVLDVPAEYFQPPVAPPPPEWKNAVCFTCEGESDLPPTRNVQICERCYGEDEPPVTPGEPTVEQVREEIRNALICDQTTGAGDYDEAVEYADRIVGKAAKDAPQNTQDKLRTGPLLETVAPGEQPPLAPSDYICPRCKRAVPENAPCPYCPAPPAQERASAKSTLVQIMVGNTWEQSVAAFERALATAAKQAREEAEKEKWGKDLLTVGWHKGEMDFGVRCSLEDLDYEQMRHFRETTVVAIGVAEDMWRRARERANPAAQDTLAAQPSPQKENVK